jgi:prevent-host-death family protein
MRTANISELKNQLSGFIQYVRSGEEVIVQDRNVPVARIIPFTRLSMTEKEEQLVKMGMMTMPTEEMDWDSFFDLPVSNIAHEVATQAAIDSRGDR